MNTQVLLFLVIAGFFISGFAGGYGLSEMEFNKYTPDKIPESEEEIIENCEGLEIEETAYCLRDNVRTFYFYTSNDEYYSDVKTLKEKGGDCSNYALLYKYLGEELGFNTERKIEEDHTYTLISKNGKYCELDQMVVDCYEI